MNYQSWKGVFIGLLIGSVLMVGIGAAFQNGLVAALFGVLSVIMVVILTGQRRSESEPNRQFRGGF